MIFARTGLSPANIRRFFAAALATACVVGGSAIPADSITLFSGVDEENRLRSVLQNDGRLNATDRYKLFVPAEKLTERTALFLVSYPEEYRADFDEDDIELRINNDPVPMRSVRWDPESLSVELIPESPIAAQTRKVSIVFSNVQNPRRTGTHFFNAYVQPPTETELPPRYIGTWIMQFGRL
ncbi:MAG: DUF2808 domain-containing protein [Cyanobacteria bacterium P01_F01_bin.150]